LEGREWEGKKIKENGRREGRDREARKGSEGWCPLN
jgi:hypothetical protein